MVIGDDCWWCIYQGDLEFHSGIAEPGSVFSGMEEMEDEELEDGSVEELVAGNDPAPQGTGAGGPLLRVRTKIP